MAYRFAVAENSAQSGERFAEAASLFTEQLGRELGERVELSIAPSYEALFEQLARGDVDFAWMPPMLHAKVTENGSKLVAVNERDGSFTYRSAILVANDGAHQRLRDLQGARMAWVDPSSAAGYVFPRLELLRAGVDPSRDLASERFYGSTAAAADAVLAGDADGCTCHVRGGSGPSKVAALADVQQILGVRADRLRVIHVSDAIPPDGIVVAGTVDATRRDALARALLGLNLTQEGRRATHELLGADSLAPVPDHLLRLIQRWAHEAEARAALSEPPRTR